MTKQMYESLGVADLKDIARRRGIRLPSGARKAEIVDLMLAQDAADAAAASRAPKKPAADTAAAVPAPAATGSGHQERTSRGPRREANSASAARGDRRDRSHAAPAAETSGAAEAASPAEGRASGEPARTDRTGRHKKVVRRVVKRGGAPAAAAEEAASATAAPAEQAPAAEDARLQERELRASEPAAPQESGAAAGSAGRTSLDDQYARRGIQRPDTPIVHKNEFNKELDSGEMAHGILEVMADGYGFIRSANYMPGENDVYVAPSQIRRFNLKKGDIIEGNIRIRTQGEKFSALLFVKSVNGEDPEQAKNRFNFEDMTPIFPDERIRLEKPGASVAMRVMDLMCPVGKGQRGMIVSPPKAGKTTLVKEVARSVTVNNPEIHLIILLIDERPEEVTDIREAIGGPNVEVIYSTFDETPEHHKKVSEMVIERAKRLVEQKKDVMILLDSITRLTRAYNLTEPSSGRTLSGGLDPAALHMPKRFFGAARNMREGGSLTILATALIETGSKMDDVVYEEFKGTGNMEMILDRKLSERRIFPAIDIAKSGTRRDDLLLTPDEMDAVSTLRRAFIGAKSEEATNQVLDLFARTKTNGEFVNMVRKIRWTF